MMFAHTTESIIQLRLPSTIHQTSTIHLIAKIRDTFDCVKEFHLQTVTIHRDSLQISNLLNTLQEFNSNDQNIIGQIVLSICQLFDEMNQQQMNTNSHFGKSSFGK